MKKKNNLVGALICQAISIIAVLLAALFMSIGVLLESHVEIELIATIPFVLGGLLLVFSPIVFILCGVISIIFLCRVIYKKESKILGIIMIIFSVVMIIIGFAYTYHFWFIAIPSV